MGTQEFADELLRELCQTLYASEEERRPSPTTASGRQSRRRVRAQPSVNDTDLSDLLPAVRVPRRSSTELSEREPSIEVANRIPGAQATQVSGSDYLEIFLSPELVDEIELFVAGVAPPAVPERVLATVMFTDIVGSTEHVAELGDGGWRDLLARHHALVRRELSRFHGSGAGHGRRRLLRFLRRTRAGDPVRRGDHRRARAARPAHARGDSRGECELHDGKLAGMAVVVGARISALAGSGEVLVSATVRTWLRDRASGCLSNADTISSEASPGSGWYFRRPRRRTPTPLPSNGGVSRGLPGLHNGSRRAASEGGHGDGRRLSTRYPGAIRTSSPHGRLQLRGRQVRGD